MTSFDGTQEVLSSVINSRNNIREAFGVSSPKNNDFVKIVLRFERANRLLGLVIG